MSYENKLESLALVLVITLAFLASKSEECKVELREAEIKYQFLVEEVEGVK